MMAGMSESFRARGEQYRRLVEYQQQQRLEALTAHVDAVTSGRSTARSYRAVLVVALGAGWLLLLGLIVWRLLYG